MKDSSLEEQENPVLKRIKRVYIILITLFLIVLLLTNTYTGTHLISLISGRIVSSKINNYAFEIKGGKVYFDSEIYDFIKEYYIKNQKAEFKMCLLGMKNGSDYYVSGLYFPTIYYQDVFSVKAEMCNEKTIISLHSHPPLRCIFSEQDINAYNIIKKYNPDIMIALICGEDRMSFYSS